jgi:NAD(P)-dependent dehydrogenase (short-subunit alcohol dehydrogenase family)
MSGKLDGRVAFITGGARGIGAATASELASAGAAIFLTDLLEEEGRNTAEQIAGSGGRARFALQDVTSEVGWNGALDACESAFGGVDILVNNAGIFFMKPMVQTSIEDFRRMTAVNVDGVFLGLKTAIPRIAKRAGRWSGGGSIVNLSSVAGLVSAPGCVAYSASKGAVRLMTKSAALECAGMGQKVRVNSVHPGVIETKMGQQVVDEAAAMGGSPSGSNEARAAFVAMHPAGRFGLPVEIARAVLFLASDDASYMTGSELVVDGGFTAR